MKPNPDLQNVAELCRVEDTSPQEMIALSNELTHAVYAHEQVYGTYCTIEQFIACPPERAFDYLADTYSLAEWTYSLRDFGPADENGVVPSMDRVGGETRIFTRTVANVEAMTVDYHCAWDQPEHLWMIYLMRVVPAPLVFNRPGCVVLWTNCRHPFYDENPFPERAPSSRSVWVGDFWPLFYAGHYIEMQNLKRILEHRWGHEIETAAGEAA